MRIYVVDSKRKSTLLPSFIGTAREQENWVRGEGQNWKSR
jgi:hypothetical protein